MLAIQRAAESKGRVYCVCVCVVAHQTRPQVAFAPRRVEASRRRRRANQLVIQAAAFPGKRCCTFTLGKQNALPVSFLPPSPRLFTTSLLSLPFHFFSHAASCCLPLNSLLLRQTCFKLQLFLSPALLQLLFAFLSFSIATLPSHPPLLPLTLIFFSNPSI